MRKIYLDRNLQLVFGVTLMVIMGVSSIVPALPSMIRELGLTPVNVGLVITSFTLPGVFMAPLTGILADRLGRKRILVPALFCFGLAGSACFFANSLHWLLILRFVQGLGAGPLGVLYGVLIADLYAGRERAAAMGYNASVLSLGTALFPAVGGALATIGWNWPFLLPLTAIPLGLACMGLLHAPEPDRSGGFGQYMRSALRLLTSRRPMALFACTLLTFSILYGPIITYLPVLMDHRFGSPPLVIGYVIGAASLVTALTSFRLGRLQKRFKPSTLMASACVFYAAGMLLFPLVRSSWACVGPVLLFGLGQGLNLPVIMTLLSSEAPLEQRAAVMAANGTLLRLSQTLSPMLMGLSYAAFGLDSVYLFGALAALAMFILTLSTLRGTGDTMDRDA